MWSASRVLIDRTSDMWCICWATSGMCSQIWIPSALVEIGLKGPPVAAPGLRSQMSMVLGPPPIQRRMADLCRFFRSAALARIELVKAVAGAARAAAPATWLMKCRRLIPSMKRLEADMEGILRGGQG